ncbi:MAG TPA: DUF4235 domain-containing protein [Solirubrobacteraceae bacterium]
MRLRRRSKQPEAVAGTEPKAADGAAAGGIATKVLYAPVKITTKRIAPKLSKSLFERIWRAVGRGEPPPRAEDPEASLPRLGLALALEGACRAIVSGLVDHASRRQFARLTGRWPGRRKSS